MKQEAEANAEADKEAKERIEVLNQADALVFQTENNSRSSATRFRKATAVPSMRLWKSSRSTR